MLNKVQYFCFKVSDIRSKDRLILENQSHNPLAGVPFKATVLRSVWTGPIEIVCTLEGLNKVQCTRLVANHAVLLITLQSDFKRIMLVKGSTMDNERQVSDNEQHMSDDEVQRVEDEEIDNKSSDDEGNNENPKRKRYHRHTQQQIETMETFFKECPHPDTMQRNELSRMTGMEPLQIKFWFQNKRTQMKSKHERQENKHLREENERLRMENMRIKEALSNACCPACGRMSAMSDHLSLDERHLRMENARLKEEVDRISAMAANYVGKPFNGGAGPSSSMRKR